jgi:hypothetical protein
MSASGTVASMTWALPRIAWLRISPRRALMSPITDPMNSSGAAISTFMTGSSRTAPPLCSASLMASRAAISKVVTDH